jgi:hypothetical protein
MKSRLLIGIKYLRQLGIRPLALYALYKFGLKIGHYKRLTPIIDNRESDIKLSNTVPLFSLPNREQLAKILGDEGKSILIKEADEIVDGKVRIFGESTPLTFNLGQTLQHWTAYETNPKLFSALYSLTPDIKFLWEPARFGWAFTLGRAYHLTQDNKYAEVFWKYFESFTNSNPPNMGPQWMNGQEVAIRLMSFVWADHVFETVAITSQERRAALHQSIAKHASRIEPTLVYARAQNNNHLVTEAAALYTAGLFLKNNSWRTLGWKWLNWSFHNQISDFGEYIQHSTNYQRVMLQTALWINLIKQDVFSSRTSQAIARSAHWLFSLLDNASGLTPNLGANDGALIFPLSVTDFRDYRPTVQAASRAFLRTSLSSGVWDELSLWFCLPANNRVINSDAYLTENLRSKNSWGYLCASRFKSRLSHMDQLHFDLWWRGLNITQDAGTYLYNAEPPWDNPLVTTGVHNTVTVDGKDQMTRAGRFLVLDWTNAYSKNIIESEENILGCVRAYHKGYHGVKHERTITVYQNENWVVVDKLIAHGRTERVYRLHWLLPDYEWKMENRESGYRLQIKSPYGWITLNITSDSRISNSECHVSLVRAGELVYGQRDVQPYEGWVSNTYGQKSPALSFVFEVTSAYHTTFTSEFVFPDSV